MRLSERRHGFGGTEGRKPRSLETYLANITLAIFEHTRVVVSGHVPEAAHWDLNDHYFEWRYKMETSQTLIIDMLAVRRGIGTGFASPEAEFVERYEFL